MLSVRKERLVKRHLRFFLTIIMLLIVLIVSLYHPQATRAAGGKLVWSVEGISELSTLDPAKATDSQSFLVINFLFARLVKLDGNLKVIPDLAQKWDISKDGLTY